VHSHIPSYPDACDDTAPDGFSTLSDMLQAGFAASDAVISVFDPTDRLVFCSAAFARLYGATAGGSTFDEIMRDCHRNGTGPHFSLPIDAWLKAAKDKRRARPHRIFEIDMLDGRWFWAHETTYNNGWLMLVLTDITQIKTKERQLKLAWDAAMHEAETDQLTGLFNRRHIMAALSDAIGRARQAKTAASIAIIDLDHFKRINDTFGHAAGDKVLCHFAGAAQQMIRRSDVLARIGGEEFMLLMPGTDCARAEAVIERLRAAISASAPVDGLALQYTFSAGVATFGTGSQEEIFQKCDDALYRAKQNGRNRVEVAG
jgi:diguanylate cyclase (GGDEF)-like protein